MDDRSLGEGVVMRIETVATKLAEALEDMICLLESDLEQPNRGARIEDAQETLNAAKKYMRPGP